MKKLLAIIFILTSFNAHSDIILKYGMVASDEPDDTNFGGIWLEQSDCTSCLSIFGIELHNDKDLVSNRIAGIDFTYKALHRPDAGTIRLTFGYAMAEKAINDSEQFNFHLGAALVGNHAIAKNVHWGLYWDHFSNGRRVLDRSHIPKNNPLDLVSMGITFEF